MVLTERSTNTLDVANTVAFEIPVKKPKSPDQAKTKIQAKLEEYRKPTSPSSKEVKRKLVKAHRRRKDLLSKREEANASHNKLVEKRCDSKRKNDEEAAAALALASREKMKKASNNKKKEIAAKAKGGYSVKRVRNSAAVDALEKAIERKMKGAASKKKQMTFKVKRHIVERTYSRMRKVAASKTKQQKEAATLASAIEDKLHAATERKEAIQSESVRRLSVCNTEKTKKTSEALLAFDAEQKKREEMLTKKGEAALLRNVKHKNKTRVRLAELNVAKMQRAVKAREATANETRLLEEKLMARSAAAAHKRQLLTDEKVKNVSSATNEKQQRAEVAKKKVQASSRKLSLSINERQQAASAKKDSMTAAKLEKLCSSYKSPTSSSPEAFSARTIERKLSEAKSRRDMFLRQRSEKAGLASCKKKLLDAPGMDECGSHTRGEEAGSDGCNCIENDGKKSEEASTDGMQDNENVWIQEECDCPNLREEGTSSSDNENKIDSKEAKKTDGSEENENGDDGLWFLGCSVL